VVDAVGLEALRFSIRSQQAINPLVFLRNTQFGITATPSEHGVPVDPSGASMGNVVLASGNTYASLSTDGGRTFIHSHRQKYSLIEMLQEILSTVDCAVIK